MKVYSFTPATKAKGTLIKTSETSSTVFDRDLQLKIFRETRKWVWDEPADAFEDLDEKLYSELETNVSDSKVFWEKGRLEISWLQVDPPLAVEMSGGSHDYLRDGKLPYKVETSLEEYTATKVALKMGEQKFLVWRFDATYTWEENLP